MSSADAGMSAGEGMSADEISGWQAYVGRTETRRQVLDAESLRRFAAAVGADLDVERRAPPLAHWAFFLESADSDALGEDGHPRRGMGLMPPVRLPHRMFASSSMRFAQPLMLHHQAELKLTVASVKHRRGKSGDLVLIEVDRVLHQEGRECLAERQTIIYRGAQGRIAPISCGKDLATPEEELWTPGAVDLFRFSAATFNSHRIHYDLPYARDVEGYPDLVVQGPLTAAKLFGFAAGRRPPDLPIRAFECRALAPLFAGLPVRLAAAADHAGVEAVRCDETIAMSARLE
jgi:3-methylfumaryl-CoA hydratase